MSRGLFGADGYDAMIRRGIAEAIEYCPAASGQHFKDTAPLIQELCKADALALATAFHQVSGEPEPSER